ncbi:MAG: FAD binding domain-containing protein [Pseudomonadota bacterium]
MKRFEHHNARSVPEAIEILHYYKGNAKVNAGGTDLLGALRDRALPQYPDAVINIKTIGGLDYVEKDQSGLRIGALARLADITRSPEVRDDFKLLAEAAHSVATPHIRSMATIGGNLAQDVRCWFYRYPQHIGGPMACLRKGGNFCSALAGDNRYHSIFGPAPLTERPVGSDGPQSGPTRKGCFAVGPSDVAVALVALDAGIVTSKRTLSAEAFFKATAMKSTVLGADELITEIRVPNLPAAAVQRYDKFTLRKPIDFAIVSAASIITMDHGICTDARIVLGAVAPEPKRAHDAEEVLKGRHIDAEIAEKAAELALAGATSLRMNGYKVEIATVLVKRAISG